MVLQLVQKEFICVYSSFFLCSPYLSGGRKSTKETGIPCLTLQKLSQEGTVYEDMHLPFDHFLKIFRAGK